MDKKPKQTVYAFIDSQNLNIGVKKIGWTLDFRKFQHYLKNKYNVDKAYLFIGQVEDDKSLYENLSSMGYQVVFKPTTEYMVDGKATVKGNVDAELVLYAAAKVFDSYDKAIIVSGDGDFHCLAEYLIGKGKLAHILVPNNRYSSLLHRFDAYIQRVDLAKHSLQLRKAKKPRKTDKPNKQKN
jgi:uncharacterized LabA/DUF88 family protein